MTCRKGKRMTWMVRFPNYMALHAVVSALFEGAGDYGASSSSHLSISLNGSVDDSAVVDALCELSRRLWAKGGS